MKQISLLPIAALIALGVALTWNSSRANDAQKNVGEAKPPSGVTQQDLIDRIDALEKRIAKLEADKSLIRQADASVSYEPPITALQPGFRQPKFLPQQTPQAPKVETDQNENRGGAMLLRLIRPLPDDNFRDKKN